MTTRNEIAEGTTGARGQEEQLGRDECRRKARRVPSYAQEGSISLLIGLKYEKKVIARDGKAGQGMVGYSKDWRRVDKRGSGGDGDATRREANKDNV